MYQYKREPLTEGEAGRLAKSCRTRREKLVVWTFLDTGLRLGKLAQLKNTNVDQELHRVTVYGKGGPYGCMSRRRTLPLSRRIRPLLETHFDAHDTLGISRRTIQRIVKAVADRASIARPVSTLILRHTFAVLAVRKGISLPTLQGLLGHDHLTTTQIYLNLSPEDVIREYEARW